MKTLWHPYAFAAIWTLVSGCGAPGEPRRAPEVAAPSAVMDFDALYASNCAGCHGAHGGGGAAIGLADPVYLAIADDAVIRKAVTNGVRGTAMPAFAESAGGMLNDGQIRAIVHGIRSRWSKPGIVGGANPPPYAATSAGDPQRGETVYNEYCESCHGAGGRGGKKGSAITNDAFLALVSDQGLRTVVIVGRPEFNAPDWRGNVPGRPMSDHEVTDLVAWLAGQRVLAPGRPYSATTQP